MAEFIISNSYVGGTKDKRFKGYIDYDGEEFPFLYENGVLEMFPSTSKYQIKYKEEVLYFFVHNKKKRKHSGEFWIKGSTFSENEIMFWVSGNYSNINGFISFPVKAFFQFKKSKNESSVEGQEKIYRIEIFGDTVNSYYNPAVIYKTLSVEEDDDYQTKIGVRTSEIQKCGTGMFNGQKMEISVKAGARRFFGTRDILNGYSIMGFSFSNGINISDVTNIYETLVKCFSYLSRCKTVKINEIKIYKCHNENLFEYGVYYPAVEANEKLVGNENDRMISHDILKENFITFIEKLI